jgi:hypothetical protein
MHFIKTAYPGGASAVTVLVIFVVSVKAGLSETTVVLTVWRSVNMDVTNS